MRLMTLKRRRWPITDALTRSPFSVKTGRFANFGAGMTARDCESPVNTALRTTQPSSGFFQRLVPTSFSLFITARRW